MVSTDLQTHMVSLSEITTVNVADLMPYAGNVAS